MQAQAQALEQEIREKYITDTQVITMETTIAQNALGETGYALHGKTGPSSEEVVTPLPGTRTVDELGPFPRSIRARRRSSPSSARSKEQLKASLMAPEVQKAFGGKPFDMTRQADRLKIWAAMYKTYQANTPAPLSAVLQERNASTISRFARC